MTKEELNTCLKWELKWNYLTIQDHQKYFTAILNRGVSREEAWEVFRGQPKEDESKNA